MNSPLAIPAELVQDAIARVDADGRFHPVTSAMHGWATTVASCIAELPLEADQLDDLHRGSAVKMTVSGISWQIQKTRVADVAWLVARDVTAIERLDSNCLAAARARSLAAIAATLAHDLNNQFSLVLALTAQLDELVVESADRKSILELESATEVGARMLSTLAQLLINRKAQSETLQPSEILADAVSMVDKIMIQGGVDLQVSCAQGLPPIRGSHVEIVQAVMEGLIALRENGAQSVKCAMSSETFTVAGGRARECVVLRCHAAPIDSGALSSLLSVVQGQIGMLSEVCGQPNVLLGLATAVFVQKRIGGDLILATEEPGVCLQFAWPAVVRLPR